MCKCLAWEPASNNKDSSDRLSKHKMDIADTDVEPISELVFNPTKKLSLLTSVEAASAQPRQHQ